MGIVYRAHDLTHHRPVALKTLHWLEPAALYRFKLEFRALAGLTHPNLVTLYELINNGFDWFFTMELVEGVPFCDHVRAVSPLPGRTAPDGMARTRGLTPAQVCALREALRQLIVGILALHEADKLHRDIKSQNVLVTREGRVVMLDFGMAADLDRSGLHQSTQPRFLGTVAYMAPEQAVGQPVSPACDWYALGVMLYEALTGQFPFTGSPLEVVMQKQFFDAPPPRAFWPEVPEDLDALAIQLLQRDPQERPSGLEILQRIGGGSNGQAESLFHLSSSGVSASLIGRASYLKALTDALQTTRQGQPCVVGVQGPAGIGKSALIRHFLDGLSDRKEAVVLAGQCHEQESVPYKAVDSLVDALSRYLARLPLAQAEAILPRDVLLLARLFPVLRRVPAVAGAPGRLLEFGDSGEGKRRALGALRELLGRLGDRQPVILFIDDLQWGDEESAVLLADLIRSPHPPALLLLVAYRSEDADSSCPSKLKREARETARRDLFLEPLLPEESCDLASRLLELEHSSPAQVEMIARESGGHPHFLREMAQHVRQHQAGPGMVPSLREVLWERILSLPGEARRLLEVVAVAGRALRQAEVCQAAGLDVEELVALAHLRSGRWVRCGGPPHHDDPGGVLHPGERRIDTYHDLIRATIVARLTTDTLQHHHRRLAHILETSGPHDPELLAIHFLGANQPAAAGRYYALAAARASDARAFGRAAHLYRLALHLQEQGGPTERALRERLADTLASAGQAEAAAREYLAASRDGPDLAEAFDLQRQAAMQFTFSGHLNESRTIFRAVLASAGLPILTPRRAWWSLVFQRSRLWWRGFDYRPRAEGQVSPELLQRIEICWSATIGLGLADPLQGTYFHTRGLLLALEAGAPYPLARALALELVVATATAHTPQRTSQLVPMVEALVEKLDHPYLRGLFYLGSGIVASFVEDWGRALARCEQAERIFRSICPDALRELDVAQRVAWWVLLCRGEVGELTRRLARFREETRARNDQHTASPASLVFGTFAHLAADHPERARLELEEVTTAREWQSSQAHRLAHRHDQVQTDLYLGEGQAAWDRLTKGQDALDDSPLFRVQNIRISLRHLRARSALTLASATPGRALLRAAEREACHLQRERLPGAAGLATLVRAAVARLRGDEVDARELLRAAVGVFTRTERQLQAAAGRHALGRLVGGTEGWAQVTEAEAWMRGQGIHNPRRMAALLVPGFPE